MQYLYDSLSQHQAWTNYFLLHSHSFHGMLLSNYWQFKGVNLTFQKTNIIYAIAACFILKWVSRTKWVHCMLKCITDFYLKTSNQMIYKDQYQQIEQFTAWCNVKLIKNCTEILLSCHEFNTREHRLNYSIQALQNWCSSTVCLLFCDYNPYK